MVEPPKARWVYDRLAVLSLQFCLQDWSITTLCYSIDIVGFERNSTLLVFFAAFSVCLSCSLLPVSCLPKLAQQVCCLNVLLSVHIVKKRPKLLNTVKNDQVTSANSSQQQWYPSLLHSVSISARMQRGTSYLLIQPNKTRSPLLIFSQTTNQSYYIRAAFFSILNHQHWQLSTTQQANISTLPILPDIGRSAASHSPLSASTINSPPKLPNKTLSMNIWGLIQLNWYLDCQQCHQIECQVEHWKPLPPTHQIYITIPPENQTPLNHRSLK